MSETNICPSAPLTYQVVVRAARAAEFPEETSTAEHDETGHVAWQAMPILCQFILSPRAQSLIKGARVIELGAGIGVPGLLAGRVCGELTLTDNNDDVVNRLRENIALNVHELRCLPEHTRVANVLWGTDSLPLSDVAARRGFDVVLGSDVVYSASSARTFLETAEYLMAQPNGVLMLAYVPRWPSVDRALFDAMHDMRLRVESVPVDSFFPTNLTPDGHPLPKGACLLLLRRPDDRTPMETNDTERPIEVMHPDGSDAWELRLGPEHLDNDLPAACGSFGLDDASSSDVIVSVDATGPFSVTLDQAQALGDAFDRPPLEGRLSRLSVKECWLGSGGWSRLGPGLSRASSSLSGLCVVGDELDEDAARSISDILVACSGIVDLELDRNPLGDPGAAALAAGVASCDALTRLSLTHCEIGSSGAAAIASALPRTLVELDLSGNGIDAIGMGHVAGAVRELKVPKLALLNVSGNEIGPNGGAELGDALAAGGLAELAHLDLRGCFLGEFGLRLFSPALLSCPLLRLLHLGSNGVSDGEGVDALAEVLPSMRRLEHLGLAMNNLSGDGAWDLVEGVVKCKSLKYLDLKGNCLGFNHGAEAIADVIPDMPSLEVVDLSGNSFRSVAAVVLAEGFEEVPMTPPRWTNGLRLIMENNPDIEEVDRRRLELAAGGAGARVQFSDAPERTTSGYGR